MPSGSISSQHTTHPWIGPHRAPVRRARAVLILLPHGAARTRGASGFARDWGGRGHACWGCRATSEEENIAIDKTDIDKGGLGRR